MTESTRTVLRHLGLAETHQSMNSGSGNTRLGNARSSRKRTFDVRNAVTLIEVVAGLALMGTLLTVIIVGNAKHVRQLEAARHKRESTRRLDQFLASWSIRGFSVDSIQAAVDRSRLPADGHFGAYGLTDSSDESGNEYRVKLRRTGNSDLGDAVRVRLTVTRTGQSGSQLPTAWAEVLVD